MLLPLQTFTSLIENMAASLQGSAAQLIDLSVGSVLRALLEASASIALWMQWLILQVLSMTRAATSTGADLDSWTADFSFIRLPGAQSAGNVVFARFTPTINSLIPVGTLVTTADASQSFVVIADTKNAAWDGSSGYVLASSVTSVVVPVQAIIPGPMGNVIPGMIVLIGTALSGVDNVTNVSGLVGGVERESDAAFRARFLLYINSRSLATKIAVASSIESVQQGLRYNILENVDLDGSPAPGNFCVFVDDGNGVTSNALMSNVSAAVDNVRPLGSTFIVSAPVQLLATISMTLIVSNNPYPDVLTRSIQQAILRWINTIRMGGVLAISKLEAIAHATDVTVTSVLAVTINGLTLDIHAGPSVIIQANGVTVNTN